MFAAVVVLHRSRDELARALASLPADTQLVVVDTGPDDGGATLAREHGATVLERRDNPGFGAANNEALHHVTRDVTVLLNPDTADLGALATLARRARTPGLHAPRLLNRDGYLQRSAHPLPGTLGAFIPALIHPPVLPRALRERAEPYRANTPRSVGWAVAACLAARTDTLRDLGPFDPSLHLFAEDMDLCLRARKRGIATILHPDLAIVHTGRHSIGHEPFEQLARNRRTAVAQLGENALRRDDAAQFLTFATRTLAGRPRARQQLTALLKQRDPGKARV